jgi:uncharacterized protein (DUF488 family)
VALVTSVPALANELSERRNGATAAGSDPIDLPMTLTAWTLGHSTRPLPDFLAVLAAYRIEVVADVRRFPGSRSQPQYHQPALESALHAAGIAYIALPDLGGRRRPIPNTPNTAWRHPAFRGYADHMTGEEFAAGLFELLTPAWGLRTAVMCAEILW